MTLFGKEVNKEGLKVFWQNLKTSSHKRTLGVLFFAVLVLSIPVTVTLVGQQQDLRQRAFEPPPTCQNLKGGSCGNSVQCCEGLVCQPHSNASTNGVCVIKSSTSYPPPQPPNKPNSSTNNPLLNNAKKATPTPIPTYNISGKVFYDKDMNSSYGSGDRLYLGQDRGQATVYLYGPVNKITRTSGGRYSFTGIPAGNYEVRLDLPDFYKATSGKCNAVGCRDKTSVNTSVGPSKTNIDFGVIALYRISGKVYIGNTSTGYNGATVKLYDTATNKLYSAVQTDKNGNYDFGKIPAIRWEVRPTVPSGYRNTTLTARNLVLQKDRTDINFGIAKKTN